MKCKVSRASQWEGQPCPEAALESVGYIDRRTSKTPEEFDEKVGNRFKNEGPWLKRGTNHRIDSHGIARDLGASEIWVVSFDTLADVLAFIGRHGGIVLMPERNYHGVDYMLTIYDDYLE